jgi:hypothetical protein
MRQYKITSENIAPIEQDGDTYLAPDDPAHEIKRLQFLGGLGADARLQEYRAHQTTVNKGSNISVTGTEKAQLMKDNNIKPGTPEWFQLWFSRPYLTHEKPVGK